MGFFDEQETQAPPASVWDAQAPAASAPESAPAAPTAAPADVSSGAADLTAGVVAPSSIGGFFGGLFGSSEAPLVAKDTLAPLRDQIQLETAKIELKGKFKIGEGTGASNDVSPEEFEKIAKLYGNIRDGKSDLRLTSDEADPAKAAELKDKTLDDIGTMLQTKTGRQLVGDLADNTTVDPKDPSKRVHRTTSIRMTDNPSLDNQCEPAGMREARRLRDMDSSNEIERTAGTPGVGTDAEVTYHPGESKTLRGTGVLATGDTTLFHELLHAQHATHGTRIRADQRYQGAEGDVDNGVRAEEMATVGLAGSSGSSLTENAYRRERKVLDAKIEERLTYN